MVKNWTENKEQCKEIVSKNPRLISTRENKGGFSGSYLTWTLVYKWMVKHYHFTFEVLEIQVATQGDFGYVRASLSIFEGNEAYEQTLALSLESFKKANGEFYNESPEALQMRVFVKLVANMTGFGFHLWEK